MKEYGDSEIIEISRTENYESNSMKMGTEDPEVVDIDTNLLCPDIIIEVKSEPIITGNALNQDESFISNYSPYDYNITSTKAQFKLTVVEEQLRKSFYRLDPECVKYSKIHCTACNAHLGSALNNIENIFVHPLLLVLVCKECFGYYSKGTFEKDEDGSEKYCRWCGQGGDVLCCSSCPMVFCKLCIRINFDIHKYAEIRDNDDWKCFSCQPNQIMAYKVQCHEYARYVQTKMCIADYYMNRDFTLCCTRSQSRKRKNSSELDPDYDPYVQQKSESDVADEIEEDGGDPMKPNRLYNKADSMPEKKMKIQLNQAISKEKLTVNMSGNDKEIHSSMVNEASTFRVSEELKTKVADTKRRIAVINNKPTIKVLGSAPIENSPINAATGVPTQKITSKLLLQPITPTHKIISSQNTITGQSFTKPIWTFTKLPQKSIILSKSSGGTFLQSNGNVGTKSFSFQRPSSVPQTQLPSILYKNIADANKKVFEANKIAFDATKNMPEATKNMPEGTNNMPEATKNMPKANKNLLGAIKVAFDATKKVPDVTENARNENKNKSEANTSRKLLEKGILDTALANGTFGSSIWSLRQASENTASDRPADLINLYNSFQEATSNMIGDLLDIKKGHILANARPGTNSRLVSVKSCQKPIPVSNFLNKQQNDSLSV